MLGVGIFVTPYAIAAATNNQAEFLISWIIAGITAFLGGIMYFILARKYPVNGGDYFYLQTFYHKQMGILFFIAMFCFAFPGSMAILASGSAVYLIELLNICFHPEKIPNVFLIASVLLILFGIINLSRKKAAADLQKIIMLLLLGLIIFTLVYFLFFSDSTPNLGVGLNVSSISIKNLLNAALMAYFSFLGFASIAYIGGEIPGKTSRYFFAHITAVIVISVIYLLIVVIYLTHIPFQMLQTSQATFFLLIRADHVYLQVGLTLILMTASLSSLNVVMLSGARLFEYIVSEELVNWSDITINKNNLFNITIWALVIISIVQLFSNTFEIILSSTVWIILLFSSLTAIGFLTFWFRKPTEFSNQSNFQWILILLYAIFSTTLTVWGILNNLSNTLKGTILIILFFLLYHLIQLLSRKSD
ncbi:MAG: amino acid permease [Calditrichia bacterium]